MNHYESYCTHTHTSCSGQHAVYHQPPRRPGPEAGNLVADHLLHAGGGPVRGKVRVQTVHSAVQTVHSAVQTVHSAVQTAQRAAYCFFFDSKQACPNLS